MSTTAADKHDEVSFPGVSTLYSPEFSDWSANICGVYYSPLKGTEPNRFHRWMHKLAFGIVWSKTGSLGQ